jgi:hypothetical protein
MPRPIPPSDNQVADDGSLFVEYRLQVFARNPHELALLRQLATGRPFTVVLRESSAAAETSPPEEPQEPVAGWQATDSPAGTADSSQARAASRHVARESTTPRKFIFFDDLPLLDGSVDWRLQPADPVCDDPDGQQPAELALDSSRRRRRSGRLRAAALRNALSGFLTAALERGRRASRLIGHGVEHGSKWADRMVRDGFALLAQVRSARPGFAGPALLPVAGLLVAVLGLAVVYDLYGQLRSSLSPEAAHLPEVRLDPVTASALSRGPADILLELPAGVRESRESAGEDLHEVVQPGPSRQGTTGGHSARTAKPSTTPPGRRPGPPASAPSVTASRATASDTAPPSVAPAPRFIGALLVQSEPAGAWVLINGRPAGTTPLRLPDVRAGSHAIRIQMDGYRRWSTAARVVANRETRLSVLLEPSEIH